MKENGRTCVVVPKASASKEGAWLGLGKHGRILLISTLLNPQMCSIQPLLLQPSTPGLAMSWSVRNVGSSTGAAQFL